MIRMDVEFFADGERHEQTFRTNNDGSYLFVGVGENRQISCDSGFRDARRMKRAIREFLAGRYEMVGRIRYV